MSDFSVMSPSKGELPGFYRDPKTGKYYREKPGDAATSESLKRIKRSVADNQMAERNKRATPVNNTLTYLRERELNGIGGLRSIHSYYGMRIDSRALKCDADLNFTQVRYPGIASVEFIKRGPSSIYGMWNRVTNMNPNFSYVVGQIPVNGAVTPSDITFRLTGDFVVDMCENISQTLVYITNSPDTGLGNLHLIWRAGNDTSGYIHYHSKKCPMFSCSHVEVNDTIHVAVGSADSIVEYNGLAPNNYFSVSGNIHAVTYDETGQFLLYGSSHGYLGLLDLREEPDDNNPSLQIQVSPKKSIIDANFLSSDQVIVTGVSNRLQTFDLRNQKCITEFYGHQHSVKKRPITVANNMVCVSGADNVIRIWHITGGAPIYEIRPKDPDSAIRGCINGDQKGAYLYYFEGSMEKIFQL